MILELSLSELGLTVANFHFLFFFFGCGMFTSSLTKLWSFKYTSFFVILTWWLRLITVGDSWFPVNKTDTIINLLLYHFKPFCSKDENVICWFKDYNHILIWILTHIKACAIESWSDRKGNEDFCFKPLFILTLVLTELFFLFSL